jgi:ubiquinone biosynthesis protein COQ9
MKNRDQLKEELLEKILTHVPFEGWSQDVLDQAAEDVFQEASYGWRLFPKGPLEAIQFWSESLDKEMLVKLPSPDDLRVREKVALAVKTRLQLLVLHREAARKTLKYLAFPAYAGQATRLLYQTVNEIWYYAGDKSTDYNFYTKRALLGWVYSSTFIYWLRDNSDDFEKTWTFLERRIEEVLTLPQLPKKIFSTLFSGKSHG